MNPWLQLFDLLGSILLVLVWLVIAAVGTAVAIILLILAIAAVQTIAAAVKNRISPPPPTGDNVTPIRDADRG